MSGPAPVETEAARTTTGDGHSGRQRLRGLPRNVVLNFGAEALAVPVGLAIVAYLTRALGAADYGLVVLAITLAGVVDWMVGSPLARASLKLVSEADAVGAAARTVQRVHVWVGVLGSAIVVAAAVPVAEALDRPGLAPLLLVLAAEPILCLSGAGLRRIAHGAGFFRLAAGGTTVRWLVRFTLVLLLVGVAGLSTVGAVAALVGALFAEFLYLRLREPLEWRGPHAPLGVFLALIAPLSLVALAGRLHASVDILLLQALSHDAVAVGLYGAARHVVLLPLLLSWSISPILLSTLGRLKRDGDGRVADRLGGVALRVAFVCLPLAAVGAGAATEVATLAFGAGFSGAGPLMGVLLFGGVGTLIFAFATVILTAQDHLKLTAALAVPVPVASITAMLFLVPRFGALGAAWATAGSVLLGAAAAVGCVEARCSGIVPAKSLQRALLLAPVAYALARVPTPGLLVVPKLIALSALVLGAAAGLGEWREVRRVEWELEVR